MLERVAIDAGRADVEREPSRIHDELVLVPAFFHACPTLLRVEVCLDARGPILAWDQVTGGEKAKVPFEQGVRGDPLAQRHGMIHLLLH